MGITSPKRKIYTDLISTPGGVRSFVDMCLAIGFHDSWKQTTGLLVRGRDNPTHAHYHPLIKNVIKFKLSRDLICPKWPFEESGDLPPDKDSYDRWSRSYNWCYIRNFLQEYGVKPSRDGLMRMLSDTGMITPEKKIDEKSILKAAFGMRLKVDVKQAVKKDRKVREGKRIVKTINTRERHSLRKEALAQWDGYDAITNENLIGNWGRRLATENVDVCHKEPIADGDRVTELSDLFITKWHRSYDARQKELRSQRAPSDYEHIVAKLFPEIMRHGK